MVDDRDTVNNKRKKIALLIFFSTLVILFIIGIIYINYKKTHISTDDAFVEGDIYTISPRLAGTVTRVYVKDNEYVDKGTLLLELDEEPHLKKLREAEAGLEAERKRLSEIGAMIKAQESKLSALKEDVNRAISSRRELEAMLNARDAELEAKNALLRQAEIDLKRAEGLLNEEIIPKERYDNAKTVYETAVASERAAKALKNQAEVSLKSHESVIAQTKASLLAGQSMLEQLKATLNTQRELVKRRTAELELAQLNLSYTKIYSPAAGYVTRSSVEVGNQVQQGQPLMAVVSLDNVYIIANYKETQIKGIRQGQRVKIKVDAYPGRTFWGHVDSIMAGTGSAFSLFPPENATGSYVKVVQRIPVKILLDKDSDREHLLRVGMSVVPTILIEK